MDKLQSKYIIDVYETNDVRFGIKLEELYKKGINLDEVYIKKMDICLNIYEVWNNIKELFNNVKIMKINAKYFLIEKDSYNSKIEIYTGFLGKKKCVLEDAQYNYMINNLPNTLKELIIYVNHTSDFDDDNDDNDDDDDVDSRMLKLEKYCMTNLPNSLKSIKIKTFCDIDGDVLNIINGQIKLPHECKFILDMTAVNPSSSIVLHNFESIEELLIEARCAVQMRINKKLVQCELQKYSSNVFYGL